MKLQREYNIDVVDKDMNPDQSFDTLQQAESHIKKSIQPNEELYVLFYKKGYDVYADTAIKYLRIDNVVTATIILRPDLW